MYLQLNNVQCQATLLNYGKLQKLNISSFFLILTGIMFIYSLLDLFFFFSLRVNSFSVHRTSQRLILLISVHCALAFSSGFIVPRFQNEEKKCDFFYLNLRTYFIDHRSKSLYTISNNKCGLSSIININTYRSMSFMSLNPCSCIMCVFDISLFNFL